MHPFVPEMRVPILYHGCMRSAISCVCALVLVACGGSKSNVDPDAPLPSIDAAPDGALADCDYTEQRDTSNDDVPPATGTPEDTGLTFVTRSVVCGTLDATHFDGDITVDVDGYVLEIGAVSDVLVRLHGPGAEAIEFVGVDIYTGAGFDQLVGTNTFYGDHAVTAVRLQPGRYELVAFALAAEAITAPVPYRLEVTADTPAARCSEVTAGGYAEALDGATNIGNDMLAIPSGAPPALTASPADVPEPTTLVVAPTANTRVTGSVAAAVAPDQYEDRDTYLFATGATTNELAVQLDWATATANLDYLLLEANTTTPIVRVQSATARPELATFAVKPNTSYWLVVGAKVGSTGLPAAYTASLCGAAYAP
jgi:hypothetical protein